MKAFYTLILYSFDFGIQHCGGTFQQQIKIYLMTLTLCLVFLPSDEEQMRVGIFKSPTKREAKLSAFKYGHLFILTLSKSPGGPSSRLIFLLVTFRLYPP